jgi:hypothetical protein
MARSPLLLTALCASIATGAETLPYRGVVADDAWIDGRKPFIDMRLGFGLMPTPETYDVSIGRPPAIGPDQSMTSEMGSDQATAFSYGLIGGSLQPVGLLYGGEIVYMDAQQRVESQTLNGVPVASTNFSDYQYRTFGFNALVGVGWRINRYLHLEGLGVLGAGWNDMEFGNSMGTSQQDGSGDYWNAGVRGGVYLTYERMVIGFVLDYSRVSYSADSEWVDATTSVDDTFSGLGMWLQIGVHVQ